MEQTRAVSLRTDLIRLKQKYVEMKTYLRNKQIDFQVLRGVEMNPVKTQEETIDYQIELHVGRHKLQNQIWKLNQKIKSLRKEIRIIKARTRQLQRETHLSHSTASNGEISVKENPLSETSDNGQKNAATLEKKKSRNFLSQLKKKICKVAGWIGKQCFGLFRQAGNLLKF